jgi:glucose/arabinose dehydrogenase
VRRPALAALACTLLAGVAACDYTKAEDDEDGAVGGDVASTTIAPTIPTTTTTPPDEPDLGAVSIALEEIADLDQPVAVAARDGDLALYIAEQGGDVERIQIVENRRTTGGGNPVVTRTYRPDGTALDISSDVRNEGEQGLLGITFATDGSRMYVAYTGEDARQHLVEYQMGSDEAQERTRRELLVIDDPYPNHNGGQLAFGPDGYLYWAMGDGGGGGDPEQTGQDPADLLGSILRIDPDVAPEQQDSVPYAIPNGNPFAAGGGAPEVWAYGLRNPWRFSFDRATGDLWVADVGQDTIEEVNVLLADGGTNAGRGANLGWPIMEGDRPFAGNEPPEGAVAPLFTYGRQDGACSVTGGYVYRGQRIPALQGVYVFADYCEGRLRGIVQRDGALRGQAVLGPVVERPSSFGQDATGELYVLSHAGPVYLVAVPD